MTDPGMPAVGRRGFLLHVVPACALTCLALKTDPVEALGQSGSAQPAQPAGHKFDKEYPQKLTYRQLFQAEYASAFIPLVQVMKRTLGAEKTIGLLKDYSSEAAARQAPVAAKRTGGNDMPALKRLFADPAIGAIWTPEVVQNTDTVYELRVSECLWATTFRQANAGEEGYAAVCNGDYAFAKALNPRLELTRDKTLMQGHECCNHRYTWKA